MATRGRPRREKKRMDAAIETMKEEYGITDEELIKKVAAELLDVYGGGNEAWCFIEKYTYLELFEAIVRENERAITAGVDSVECGTGEIYALTDAAGPSSLVAEPGSLMLENAPAEKGSEEDANHLGKDWKDIGMDAVCLQNSGSNEDAAIGSQLLLLPPTPLTSNTPSRPETSPVLSPLAFIPSSPVAAITAPSRRRRPCYGWIESDEEEIDLIELTPAEEVRASTADSLELEYWLMGRKNNRRSRWDMRPGDP